MNTAAKARMLTVEVEEAPLKVLPVGAAVGAEVVTVAVATVVASGTVVTVRVPWVFTAAALVLSVAASRELAAVVAAASEAALTVAV